MGQLPAKNARLYGECVFDDKEIISFECETKGSVFPTSEPIPMWIVGIREVDRDAIMKGTTSIRLRMTLDYYGTGTERYKQERERTNSLRTLRRPVQQIRVRYGKNTLAACGSAGSWCIRTYLVPYRLVEAT